MISLTTATWNDAKMKTFENLESEVRSYSRGWPTVFEKSKGYKLWDTDGKEYIDFFAGAGTLNYGHNDDAMQEKLIEYIKNDGVIHSLTWLRFPEKIFWNALLMSFSSPEIWIIKLCSLALPVRIP